MTSAGLEAYEAEQVKGMGDTKAAAEAGLKLFTAEVEMIKDTAGAEAYKKEVDDKIAALQAEEAALTGKDNKKARTEKGKEISAIKVEPKYIDACKVVKGLDPKNGFFATTPKVEAPAAGYVAAPAAAAPEEKKDDKKKDDKPKKKMESTGLGPDEKKELDKLKTDIIDRKTQLKAEGMSGGQQNKDEEIVKMVTRMNELKEKENPGSTAKPDKKPAGKTKALSAEKEAEKAALEKEIDEYRGKLKTEFGYSAKDIKADPDLVDMEKKLKEFK